VSTADFNRLSFVYSFSDFDMSDAQQEHALAVEHLAPRLAALRIELCPGYMSEGCFWKIYFVLLHPRLSKHDAELLSTPQVCCFFVAGLVVSLIYLLLLRISIETVVTLHFGSIAIHEHEVSLVQSI
jgi:hypothetical protein